MATLWQFVRPFTMLAPAIGFVSAALMAAGRFHLRLADGNWALIAVGMLAAALLNAASNGLNQVCDVPIDRINRPERPIPSGRLSPRRALLVSLGLYLVALALAAWLHPLTFALFLVAACFTVAYSVPPARTKRRGWLANLSIAIPRGVLIKAAGWSALLGAVTPETWYLGLVFGLFVFGASTTKDLADIDGDRAYDCATLPVVYGPRRAVLLIAPFFTLPWLLLPLGAVAGILAPDPRALLALGVSLSAWGAVTVAGMMRLATSGPGLERRTPWRQMYLLLMAAQLGLAAAYLVS